MPIDTLKRYARLREALVSEKAKIESRLAEINSVLEPGAAPASAPAAPVPSSSKELVGYTPRRGSLPARILKALEKAGAPMQVQNIASAVKKKPVLVSQGCLLLLKKGRLRREGRGQYSLANR